MLSLSHINVKFPSKIVFNDASFSAYNGLLTVIKGKSGIGKSTLIEALLFQYDCQYSYHNIIISSFNDEEKSKFLYEHISVVYQIPPFIDSLTIKEHISLTKDLYQITKDESKLIKRLNIKSLLDKFPRQLSGGEKTKIALFLSLLKRPEILILDEPTASLDEENKKIVIDILKNYTYKRKAIVIITTHDQDLIDEADCLYEINNHQLKEIKTKEIDDIDISQLQYQKSFHKLDKYVNKIRKHYKPIYKLMMLLLSMTIGLMVLSYSINNASIIQINNSLNEMINKEIIVYKPLTIENSYSFNSFEYPMTDEEVKIIKETEHIEKVEWRFDYDIDNYNLINGKKDAYDKYDTIDDNTYTLYDKDKKINSFQEQNSAMYMRTYIDDYDYSHVIGKTWGNEGVYITPELYKRLFNGKEIDEPYLEFCMMIPMYDSQSEEIISENETKKYVGNHVCCDYKIVRLPIRGVTVDSYLTHENSTDNQIFIPRSYLQSLIEKQKVEDKVIIYWSNQTSKAYYNKKPDHVKIDCIYNQTKWKPCGYSVFIDDSVYLNQVVKDLISKGFRVESQYINTNDILYTKENIKNTMMIVSSGVTLLIGSLYFFMKYMNRKTYFENDKFLKCIGLNKQEIQSFKYSEWIKNVRDMFIMGSISFLVMRMILHSTKEAFIRLEPKIFIMILVFTLISEFIFPYIVTRVMGHDSY